jgi:diguanylate cyclase (GGDEF)-like protein
MSLRVAYLEPVANQTRGEQARAQLAGKLGLPAADLRRLPVRSVEAVLERVTALEHQAAQGGRDELTGVWRRGEGLRRLEAELERMNRDPQYRVVVAFVDVDGLKQANDGQGHAEGDRRLKTVGTALLSQLRSYDTAFRYGGDEFVCVLAATTLAEAKSRLGSMAADLRGQRAPVSLGITAAKRGETAPDLLERADSLMYEGRRQARAARQVG